MEWRVREDGKGEYEEVVAFVHFVGRHVLGDEEEVVGEKAAGCVTATEQRARCVKRAHGKYDGDDYEREAEAEQRPVVERGVLEHPARGDVASVGKRHADVDALLQ